MVTSKFPTLPSKSSDDWSSLRGALLREIARRNQDSLLDWSLAHRFFRGQPMKLTPALADLYRDDHACIVIQKAAQVGISEYLINTALWTAETGQGRRGNALYVMPTQTQMDDLSQARFDRAIAESPYLSQRLQPPGQRGPVRVHLKRLGQGYIYLRGSESRRQLSSVDADTVLLDEFDLMAQGVLELAQKRLASSQQGRLRVASTPRLPEAGINDIFLQSDRRYYFYKCPACGRDQRLEWPANVDEKRFLLVCRFCRKPLDLWLPGHWEAEAPGNEAVHGYHLNRLYSPMADLRQVVEESQATTPAAVQEFQNSVLGETFVPPGGQVSLDTLDRCRREYSLDEYAPRGKVYMGVDVGLKLHVVIREQLAKTPQGMHSRLLFAGEVDSFEELDALAASYNVRTAFIDATPELRQAMQFARKLLHSMRVYLAYYDRSEPGYERSRQDGVSFYHLNRTDVLDELFDTFRKGLAELPGEARRLGGRVRDGLGEYYRELMALKRVFEQNSQGNWVARYLDQGKADHYAHAEVYALQAMHKGCGPGIYFLGGGRYHDDDDDWPVVTDMAGRPL